MATKTKTRPPWLEAWRTLDDSVLNYEVTVNGAQAIEFFTGRDQAALDLIRGLASAFALQSGAANAASDS